MTLAHRDHHQGSQTSVVEATPPIDVDGFPDGDGGGDVEEYVLRLRAIVTHVDRVCEFTTIAERTIAIRPDTPTFMRRFILTSWVREQVDAHGITIGCFSVTIGQVDEDGDEDAIDEVYLTIGMAPVVDIGRNSFHFAH